MKKTMIHPACSRVLAYPCLITLAIVLAASSTSAQTLDDPPERMTYQGFLVDGVGDALGKDNPQNYDVIFSIFNDQNASAPTNLLWDEQQTVTVDKGYFSVLLGEGAESTPGKHGNLSTLFTGSGAADRYVGITVVGIGDGNSNVNILPRLRLMSVPYAFLAANAVQSDIANIALSADGAALTSGTVPDARLSPNVALLTGAGGKLPDSKLSSNVALLSGAGGTLPDNKLSANVAKLNQANTFTAGNTFAAANTFRNNQTIEANTGFLRSIGGFYSQNQNLTHLEFHHGQNLSTGWRYKIKTISDSVGTPWLSFEVPSNGTGGSTEVFRLDGSGPKVGSLSLATGEERLRIIRGRISENGSVALGSGFSSTRTSAGTYTITFNAAFSGAPSVTANVYVATGSSDNYVIIRSVSSSGFELRSRDEGSNGGDHQDSDILFIAIGPR